MSVRKILAGRKSAFGWKTGVSEARASRPSTRDRIVLSHALRDLERRLTEAEALADKNLAISRERLAVRK